MSEQEMKELEWLSEQQYYGDMTFNYDANLIAKLIKEYKQLKVNNNYKIKQKIKELENATWYCESVKNQTIQALEELLEE